MSARRPTPEKGWQDEVIRYLHAAGWVVDHSFPLPTRDGGWRTGSTWIGKPDLLCVRPPRVLAIEVKADGGRATAKQIASLSWWAGVPCAHAWLLPPGAVHTGELREWLARPAKAPSVFGFDPMDPTEAYRVLATATQRRTR